MSENAPLGVIAYHDAIGIQQRDDSPRGIVLRSPLSASTTQLQTSGLAYFVCVGYRPAGEVIQYVRFGVSTAGAGTQTAEVAVAYTTTAPAGSAMTLTKLWADGTLDSLLSTGVKGNTTANAVPLPIDAWVFVCTRFAMGTTQPTLHILQRDWGLGWLSSQSGASALTSSTTYTATPVTFSNNTAPDVRGYT